MVTGTLSGLGAFALYFGLSFVALLLFKVIYTLITPHDEWALVKQNNSAAAVALAGTLIGYAIALASAASNSIDLIDFAIWAVVALLAQLIGYALVRLAFLRQIVTRIENGEIASGIVLAGVSISIGLLNAACMTW